MITETYISLETAKLLKSKGITVSEDKDDLGRLYIHAYTKEGKEVWGCYHPDYYPIFTYSLTMKYLREIHNLSIEVYRTACGYVSAIVKIPSGTDLEYLKYSGDDLASGQYTTWEKACDAAIIYSLEHLI